MLKWFTQDLHRRLAVLKFYLLCRQKKNKTQTADALPVWWCGQSTLALGAAMSRVPPAPRWGLAAVHVPALLALCPAPLTVAAQWRPSPGVCPTCRCWVLPACEAGTVLSPELSQPTSDDGSPGWPGLGGSFLLPPAACWPPILVWQHKGSCDTCAKVLSPVLIARPSQV